MIIDLLPAFSDNYLFLAREPDSTDAFTVDPGDAEPILERLQRDGLTLRRIFLTHHHSDHVDGVATLVRATGCEVFGPPPGLPNINAREVHDGTEVTHGRLRGHVLHLPGHTLNHVAYHWPGENALFCGDVLFGLGCGRLFEGTHEQAFASLARLKALVPSTRIYCAHEYTETNVRFCETHGLTPPGFTDHAANIRSLRQAGRPTVPLVLSDELRFNPFLTAESLEVFRERRLLRNRFRG